VIRKSSSQAAALDVVQDLRHHIIGESEGQTMVSWDGLENRLRLDCSLSGEAMKPLLVAAVSQCRYTCFPELARGTRPESANAEGDPRPKSMMKTRWLTTSADEVPARPATGMGAPAVPRSTNSVVVLTSSFSFLHILTL